ncbi:hypothetical protein B488_09360 [Liberibacter crescens BT-1]|uniref:Flagellar protein FlgJ N-terminal domain-containing protein n=1 Tax=Liberibacter crescens (strain BT-1) TaxID=1215343 RepID=L0EW93_LIBCB|nr:rod-binding protein [Liberibacter crescens]AGA64928.1 hypothetical protein B488_09360 [Liberibacter crescens BT-1]
MKVLETRDLSFLTKGRHLDQSFPAIKFPKNQVEEIPEIYNKFESLVLQCFIKSILPQKMVEPFGKGFAGDFLKDLLSQHIGTAISLKGGVGLASQAYLDQKNKTTVIADREI